MFDIKNLSSSEREEIISKLPIYSKIKKLENLVFQMGIYEYDYVSSSKLKRKSAEIDKLRNEIINELVVLYLLDS